MWIQTGVTVRKRLSWVVTSVTLTFDLWPWYFAWTLPWSLVITPENFMVIQWWKHSQKGVTDGQKIPFIELLGRSLKYVLSGFMWSLQISRKSLHWLWGSCVVAQVVWFPQYKCDQLRNPLKNIWVNPTGTKPLKLFPPGPAYAMVWRHVRIGHVLVTDHLPPYNETCTQNVKKINKTSSPEQCNGF